MYKKMQSIVKLIESIEPKIAIEDLSHRRGGHIKARLRNTETGKRFLFIFPYSPSDWRAMKNAKSALKRIIRKN